MTAYSLNYQIEHFCDNCPHCEIGWGGTDEAYGVPMTVGEVECPALGDPEDKGCPNRDEYRFLLDELEREEAGEDEE